MRCQQNLLPLNVSQERRGEPQGYVRITGCANCSGTAVYKGIFFSLSRFSEWGTGASERPLKMGVRLFRGRAVAFLCKWQMKMKCAYSGFLFELKFSCNPFRMPNHRARFGPVWGFSTMCSQRMCDCGSVCSKLPPISVKNGLLQCHVQKSHCCCSPN